MTRLFLRIHQHVFVPTGKSIVLGMRFNTLVWTKYFDAAWEATPLYEKLTWVLLLVNTMCILTLFQILAFR